MQAVDVTTRLLLPVSKITLRCCGGVPTEMTPMYCVLRVLRSGNTAVAVALLLARRGGGGGW